MADDGADQPPGERAPRERVGPVPVTPSHQQRGGDGAEWHAAGGVVVGAAVPTTVVDTIGAGDTFSAATIDALWDGLDPASTVAHAARAAAVTVSRPGADPPTRAELA